MSKDYSGDTVFLEGTAFLCVTLVSAANLRAADLNGGFERNYQNHFVSVDLDFLLK